MKKRILLLCFFSFIILCSKAQIYYNDTGNFIGKVDMVPCEVTQLGEALLTIKFPAQYSDIAISPDGRLYGFTGSSQLKESYLIEIDIVNRMHVDTILTLTKDNTLDVNVTSLVVDNKGIFYFGSATIQSYDPQANILTGRGDLYSNDNLDGDLVFFNDKLYGGTVGIFSADPRRNIYEIDTTNAANSIVVFEANSDTICLSAMTVFWDNMAREKKLIASTTCRYNGNRRTYIDAINLDSSTLETLCAFNIPLEYLRGNDREVILGMTSEDEFRNNFDLRLDLDLDNSRGRLIDHFIIDSLCTVKFPIGDADIWVRSQLGAIDSVSIQVAEGILAPGEEVIFAEVHPDFDIKGQGTARLVAVNKGQATDRDVEDFLGQVWFEITADLPTSGQREIHTQLFAQGQASDIARSFIPVQVDVPLTAGPDVIADICDGNRQHALFDFLEGARQGGRWYPELREGERGFFIPAVDTPGVYSYIAEEGGCRPDTAKVTVNLIEGPPISVDGDSELQKLITICPGDSLVWDIAEGVGDYFYLWSDSRQGPRQVFTFEDTEKRHLLVLQSNGPEQCPYEYQLLLRAGQERVEIEQQISVCSGDHFTWDEQTFTVHKDTLICTDFRRALECDSTHCLRILVQEPEINNRSVNICEGNIIDFYGQQLSETGVYTKTFQNAIGCDSTISLNLMVSPSYFIEIDTLIQQGDTIRIAGQTFNEAGRYRIPYRTNAGCDSTYQVNIDFTTSTDLVEKEPVIWASNIIKTGTANYQLQSKSGAEIFIEKMVITDMLGRLCFQIENTKIGAVKAIWEPRQSGTYWCYAELSMNGRNKIFTQKVIVVD